MTQLMNLSARKLTGLFGKSYTTSLYLTLNQKNMKTKSIIEKLESWLNRGYAITPIQALNKWGCFRLSARIHNLREMGYAIETLTQQANGKTFAKYKLVK